MKNQMISCPMHQREKNDSKWKRQFYLLRRLLYQYLLVIRVLKRLPSQADYLTSMSTISLQQSPSRSFTPAPLVPLIPLSPPQINDMALD